MILELESSVSGNIRNFFRGEFFFIFLGLGWEVQSFISGNISIFFNIRARKFHFLKYKEFFSRWIFVGFLGGWAYKVLQGTLNNTTINVYSPSPSLFSQTSSRLQDKCYQPIFTTTHLRLKRCLLCITS